MENQKSNKVLVVFLILFIIITILLGCYIIFSKNSTNKTVNNSQKNDGRSDNVSNVVNSEYNYNLTKRTTTQAVKESTYKMKVTVDTEGNVYLDCNDSVINDVKNENIKKNLTNLINRYVESTLLWKRTGTTLSPKTDGDNISTSGRVYQGV